MNYGEIIKNAWTIARGHTFLWVLGLFAANLVGGCSNSLSYRVSGSDLNNLSPQMPVSVNTIGIWLADNAALVFGLMALGFLLFIAVTIVSSIATAGMSRATTGLALGERVGASEAWQAGLGRFPRYYGLALLGIAYAVVAVGVVVVLFVLAVSAGQQGGAAAVTLAIVLGLVALAAMLASIVVLLGYAMAAQYAQLEMALADIGPIVALRGAIDLIRREPGTTLILWLIAIALGVGAAIVLGIAFVVLAAVLGGIGAVVYFATEGLGITTLVYAAIAVVAVLGLLWAATALLSSFLWSYWALAYVRLTGRASS